MTPDAHRTVARARDLNASNEAILRAALAGMALSDGMALLAKLHREWLHRQQEATHAAPI